MTRILGSVRNLAEAQLLLQTPIEILDLKDPDRGALGAADFETVRHVVRQVRGRRRISAAAGFAEDPEIQESVARLSQESVDFVKIGFSSSAQQSKLPEFRAAMEPSTGAVAVLFADGPDMHPMQWIKPARAAGFSGLMLDTGDKHAGPLQQHMSLAQARDWVQATRDAGLLCGLAGQLDAESAGSFLVARPDYLGFRGALCDRSLRAGPICLQTTRALLDALRAAGADLPDFPPPKPITPPAPPAEVLQNGLA